MEDIKQYDEGLYNKILFLINPYLTEEKFNYDFEEETFSCVLTDGNIFEFIPNGANKKVTFEERFKYVELIVKARLSESDNQIRALKKGLCKLIPESLLKCKINFF